MINEHSTKDEILSALNETIASCISVGSTLNDENINKIPFEDSWTAGQLFDHVIKSIGGMGEVMTAPGKKADRNPGEQIAGLKKTFLDFSSKMKSPKEIVPGNGPFKKQTLIDTLQTAVNDLNEAASKAKLDEIVEGLPFGPITKLELLHFVVYHTQRHLHQLKKITAVLND